MLTPEILEAAQRLEKLIEAEEKRVGVSPDDVRAICRDLLVAVNADGLGGCLLCQY